MKLNKKIACILPCLAMGSPIGFLVSTSCTINNTKIINDINFENNAANFFEGKNVKGNIAYTVSGVDLTITSATDLTGQNLTFKSSININGSSYNLIAIGDNAFKSCIGISGTLTLSEGIISVGSNAFNGCTNLNLKLTLPKSLTTIGDNAFCNTYFNSISIDSENEHFCLTTSFTNTDEVNWVLVRGTDPVIKSVDQIVSGLTIGTIYLSDNVSGINGTSVFENCGNLNNIKFASESTTISEMPSFQNCTSLHQIWIPKYISNISDTCFTNTSVTYIWVDQNNKNYGMATNLGIQCGVLMKANSDGSFTWNDDTTAIPGMAYGVIFFPSTQTKVADYAFAYCTNIHNAAFFNSPNLISIGDYAFYKCKCFGWQKNPYNLIAISFNDKVETIGQYAFYGCSYVDNIYLPSSLKQIGDYAFCVNVDSNNNFIDKKVYIQYYWNEETLKKIINNEDPEYSFGENIFPLTYSTINNQKTTILNPNLNIYVQKSTSSYYKNNKSALGLISVDETGYQTEISNKNIHEGNIPISQKVFINSLALGLGLGLGIPLTIGTGTGIYLYIKYKKTK